MTANSSQSLALARRHHEAGRLADAEQLCRQIIGEEPHNVTALQLLGVLAVQTGRHAEAIELFEKAVDANPSDISARRNLGSAYSAAGRFDEGRAALEVVARLAPTDPEAHYNLGLALWHLGRVEEAVAACQRTLQLNPAHGAAERNLGVALHRLGRMAQAEHHLLRARELEPGSAASYVNLGAVLQDQKRFDEALEQYRAALALDEKSVESLINVGAVLQMQGHPEQSLDFHRRALAIDPNNSRAHYSRAAALHALHRTDEAIESYAEAIRLKPDYAKAYYNRSFVWLSRGDFARGWPDYEWRFRCKDYVGRRFDAPRWDGSPLAGRTLLVHAEQGLGDTMHFIRYVKLLEGSGGSVIVEVQPALLPLLKASGLTNVIGDGTPLPRFDVHASLLSLPGLLGTNLENMPAKVPYLATDPRQAKEWRGRLRAMPGFKVGIVWQGNPAFAFDHLRSIPLVEFAPLADVPGVQLVSLQKSPGQEQLAACADRFTAIDLGSTLDSQGGAFVETAAVMCNLDLVVTSDTAGAHLAGALGVPTWLALAHAPEWRWLMDRDDSPWYPTMRLFRQPTAGNWSAVFREIAGTLAARI